MMTRDVPPRRRRRGTRPAAPARRPDDDEVRRTLRRLEGAVENDGIERLPEHGNSYDIRFSTSKHFKAHRRVIKRMSGSAEVEVFESLSSNNFE
jgi:hypothetical protein